MTRAGRPPPEFGEVSPAKALRLALAKSGQEILEQAVTGSGIEELKVGIPAIQKELPESALVLDMTGPGGCRGLVALDRSCVAAITEALTTGRISGGELPERKPSRTDALLCRKFLVMVMTVFAARLVGHPDSDWATGFVPDEPVFDLRRLPVIMEDVPYRLLRMETDFGLGARIGQVCIVVPWAGPAAVPPPAEALPPPEEDAAAWCEALEAAIMPARVELAGVLCRREITVRDYEALEAGSLIRIPMSSIANATLETATGQKIFRGRLGELDGDRALKVEWTFEDGEEGETLSAAQNDEADEMGGMDLADAMSKVPPVDLSLPSLEDEPEPELPPLDLDALEAGEGLPDLGDGGFPAMDLGEFNMDELDDLPETID